VFITQMHLDSVDANSQDALFALLM